MAPQQEATNGDPGPPHPPQPPPGVPEVLNAARALAGGPGPGHVGVEVSPEAFRAANGPSRGAGRWEGVPRREWSPGGGRGRSPAPGMDGGGRDAGRESRAGNGQGWDASRAAKGGGGGPQTD